MAGLITYNATPSNLDHIYTTTGGGTVFSANLATSTAYNYFSNTAVVNDAIYFGRTGYSFSDLLLNVGTALVGTGITIVWEYYCGATATWRTCHNLTDSSNGFTTTGSVKVQFPLQARMAMPTINSVTYAIFVRARISAITSISSGGANSAVTVKRYDGVVNLAGYTDASPCTWLILYTWIIANAPQIGATRVSYDTFKFDSCSFNIPNACTLRSNSEKIFIGNGSWYNGSTTIGGLWSGTKVGTNGWTTPSEYFFCYTGPSTILTSQATTRIYGGVFEYFTNIVDGIACSYGGVYLGIGSGEWIGVYARQSGYFNNAVCDRCTVDGGLITAGVVAVYPTNLQIANPLSYIWSIYGNSVDLPGVTYAMPTSAIISYSSQYVDQGQTVNVINPNPALPSQSGAIKTAQRTLGTLVNIYKCFFYDAIATTYTDYTTQAGDATASDVPLGINTNDCLYILASSTMTTVAQTALTFTIPAQTNDYVYSIEYYRGGAWVALGALAFDLTANFTQTGIIYMGTGGNVWQSITINGVVGFWHRIRVVTPGTGTPMLSKIQARNQTGIGNQHINEKYDYNISVTDTSGTAIQNVIIYIQDTDGNIINTLTTDVNGAVTKQVLIKKYLYFDKNTSEADFNFAEKFLNPYTLTLRKYGYTFAKSAKTISGISSDTFQLQTNIYTAVSAATAGAYTGIAIDGVAKTVTVTDTHTLQEIYDYSQWWASQSANMGYDEPITTTDGNNFTLAADWVITIDAVTVTATGKKLSATGTGTYTIINGGDFTGIIANVSQTRVKIETANIVNGSRIQLYDVNSATELANSVAGTSHSIAFIHTGEDHTIRLRLMYASGVTAKNWYEVTGTVTNTGLAFNAAQTDDTVYNSVNIDGSSVTECAISGATVRVYINDSDNTTTAQRIYNWFRYYLATSAGISQQSGAYITATDNTHYIFDNSMKIINQNTAVPLEITGANITSVSGSATGIFDVSNGASIILNFNRVEGFAIGSGVTSQDKTDIIQGVRGGMNTELDAILTLLKVIKNKREIKNIGTSLTLFVYDDDGITPILSKDLKDITGANIADLASGVLAQELASSV